MPIIKSARKKLRQDKKRTAENTQYEKEIKEAIRAVKKGGKDVVGLVKRAYSKIDKAAKRNIIHKNKANRLKSEISKLISHKKNKTSK
jgi:small subunit ribosomal protein S20